MRTIAITIGLLLASASVLFTCQGCSPRNAAATTNEAPTATSADERRVIAGPPTTKTLEVYTTQPARIEAFEEAPLYSKLTGYVQKVHVDISDQVTRDQTLITLWMPELEDELRQKEALVAQAEAEVKQAKARIDSARAAEETARARILEAEAGVGRAVSEHQRSESEYSRIQELAAGGSVTKKLEEESRNQFRSAEAAFDEAKARQLLAQAALDEAKAHVRQTTADHVAAEARLGVAHADAARAKTMFNYTRIRAPFDGIVTRRAVDTGHHVSPANGNGAKPLLVVAQSDEVRVFVDVPELQAPLVEIGDPAQVMIQSLQSPEIVGEVIRTSWSLQDANRSLRAEINLPNPDGQMRPGMYATVTIRLAKRENALVLPMAAIVREGDETFAAASTMARSTAAGFN